MSASFRKTICLCVDPYCPACKGDCTRRAKTVLRRGDMEDTTGTPMCNECAEDALSYGIFFTDLGQKIKQGI